MKEFVSTVAAIEGVINNAAGGYPAASGMNARYTSVIDLVTKMFASTFPSLTDRFGLS